MQLLILSLFELFNPSRLLFPSTSPFLTWDTFLNYLRLNYPLLMLIASILLFLIIIISVLRSPEKQHKKESALSDQRSLAKNKNVSPIPNERITLRSGLIHTRNKLIDQIDGIFSRSSKLSDELYKELEHALITSDVGVKSTQKLLENLKKTVEKNDSNEDIRLKLKLEVEALLTLKSTTNVHVDKREGPYVLLVVGVNGVGKTTTIGKIASKFKMAGKKVVLGAGDTYRAAAVDQLKIWGERTKSHVVTGKENADPASVAYQTVEYAINHALDVAIIDTAGRLHTKSNLMDELLKVKRVIGKRFNNHAPHDVLMVLDATTGQNAISQAKTFNDVVGVTQFALTELDGTAKGGVIIGIIDGFQIPVKYIGVGEAVEDLHEFEPRSFTESLFG